MTARWVAVAIWIACTTTATSGPQRPRYTEQEMAALDTLYAKQRFVQAFELAYEAPRLLDLAMDLQLVAEAQLNDQNPRRTAEAERFRHEIRIRAEMIRFRAEQILKTFPEPAYGSPVTGSDGTVRRISKE